MRRILLVVKSGSRRPMSGVSAAVRRRMLRADRERRRSIEEILRELSRRGLEAVIQNRAEKGPVRGFDLVIVAGGDGTLLDVAGRIGTTPAMMVNPAPSSSVAIFSCCEAKEFGTALELVLNGRLPITRINRLRVRIAGLPELPPVLNEVLFACLDPAALCRYTLAPAGGAEEQWSSGVWISSAAGSTGAVLAAGGRPMDIRSTRIQFVVREPFVYRRPYRFLRGITPGPIRVTPQMPGCAVWLDGNRRRHRLEPGQRVTISSPGLPLNLVGFREDRRRRLLRLHFRP